ncbi:hypothetical protein [Pseudomonas frederiksbergensis]|uniref:Secreted protein n=1 Tax=Pseudomonas frederiksbergensis TaxID=104087 RepID=A0A423HEE7_9PSED|nr:hypothetical protein [Pseudomonas frederiksbergensis]RON11581.1 hypothetical protein BK662_31745 [Pseudomonas frederiksbergensis]
MSRLSPFSLCVVMLMVYTQVQAETVVPLKGQTSQQIQLDINDCSNVTASQSTSSPPPSEGAAVDATQVPGRQHDEFYEQVEGDVKQHDHGCLQGRGYQVTP